MQKIHCVLILLLYSFSPYAQTWQPVGGGLSGGDTVSSFPGNALCVYNKKLYVGGAFKYAGKVQANHIAAWDGIKWQALNNGTDDFVQALCVYDNMLCAGGAFTEAGGTPASCFAYWVDTLGSTKGWYAMGSGMQRPYLFGSGPNDPKKLLNNIIQQFTVYSGGICALVNFSRQGHTNIDNGILKWNKGAKWFPICRPQPREHNPQSMLFYEESTVLGFGYGMVWGITTYRNQLCVAGDMSIKYDEHTIICVPAAFAWDGKAMHPIGKDTMKIGPWTCSLFAFDTILYAVGEYKPPGKSYGVVKWDGKEWSPVGKWEGEGKIYCMAEYHKKLYIGGKFDSICGKPANGIACWDGNAWEPIGAGFSESKKGTKAFVHSLCVYKDELYAAGEFTSSGNTTVLNIAKLNNGKK